VGERDDFLEGITERESERATCEPHCGVDTTNPASNTASRPEPELRWNVAAYVNSPCGFFCGSFYLDLSWDFPPELALRFATRSTLLPREQHHIRPIHADKCMLTQLLGKLLPRKQLP